MKIFKRKSKEVKLMNSIMKASREFPNNFTLGEVIRTFTNQIDKMNPVDEKHFNKILEDTIKSFKQNKKFDI